jgi:RNA polymerase sigma-70 factor (ECF subfamily)
MRFLRARFLPSSLKKAIIWQLSPFRLVADFLKKFSLPRATFYPGCGSYTLVDSAISNSIMNSVRTDAWTDPGGEGFASRQQRFLDLLRPQQASLSRFAKAMTGNAESAKDLVSETVLKAYESFDRLKDVQSFQSYLFTIAVRLANRERSRGKRWADWDEEQMSAIPSQGESPETRIEVELLYRALQQLPEKQREAIVLFEITGLSLEEIREIQGGSLSGVKSRIVRGRDALADLLGVTAERDQIAAQPKIERPINHRPLFAVGSQMIRATEVKR